MHGVAVTVALVLRWPRTARGRFDSATSALEAVGRVIHPANDFFREWVLKIIAVSIRELYHGCMRLSLERVPKNSDCARSLLVIRHEGEWN